MQWHSSAPATSVDKRDHIMAEHKIEERQRHRCCCLSFRCANAYGAEKTWTLFFRLDNRLAVAIFKTQ
jgi:hypothetical protein